MLRIRTREEKYQIMTSIKRATFECTEVSFIELLKKKLRLLNCSPSELLQAITDMKEFIVRVLDKDKCWCAERGIYDWFVSEIFQVSLTTMHLPLPMHPLCKTSSVLPDLIDIQQPIVASLSTLLIWIQV